ncbi:hypothetical protein ABWJ26_000227 [Vibrio fluvialis]
MPVKSKVEELPSLNSFISLMVDAAPYIGAVVVIVSLVLYLAQKSGARRDIVKFTLDKESSEKSPAPKNHAFFNGMNAFFTDLKATENKRDSAQKSKVVRVKLKDKGHIEVLKILLDIESTQDVSKRKSNTIVGMMLEEKFASSNKNARLLSMTIFGYMLITYFDFVAFNILALIVPMALLSALLLDKFLITLRIRRGWYGRNEYEAREIINYVSSHANKDDFNDDGGLKKLMDAPELVKEQAETLEGGVRT